MLFSGALAELRRQWPRERIVVLVRRPLAGLGRLLVAGVEWWETSIDPYTTGPVAAMAEYERLSRGVRELAPEVVVAAGSRRTWLEIALAAAVSGGRKICLGAEKDDPWFSMELRLATGIASTFDEALEVPESEPDWVRAYRIVDALTGTVAPRHPPALALDAEAERAAEELLAGLGLEPGRYLFVAAAGHANVRMKAWPPERFARVLSQVWSETGLPSLVAGHASETRELAQLAEQAGPATRVWTGGDDELALLAGIVASARACFGNDTGAMHLACALGRPAVTLYGGGTWPRFALAAGPSIALVHPLPCFGCGWDCPFGDAPCVRAIPEEAALRAIRELLDGPVVGEPEVRSLSLLGPETVELFRSAGEVARERARERLAVRAHLVEQTHAAAERLRALHEKEAEIARLAAALARERST